VLVRRRTFLAGALATALVPQAVAAQTAARPLRLGILVFSDPGSDPNMRAIRETLRDLGYVEGQNLFIDYRYAESRTERLKEIAVDLVRAKPDVIFALGGDVATEAVAATRTIPTVISVSNDPVRARLVESLSSPGGHVTGVTFLATDLAAKRLQLLREAAGPVRRVAVIRNPNHVDDEFLEVEAGARALGIQALAVDVPDMTQLERELQAAATAWKPDAMIAVSSRQIVQQRAAIIAFATNQRLPLAGGWGLWADTGALLSYGPDIDAMMRRAVGYVDRIAKGARPASLPIEQPTKFELVLNRKTARALGITLSESLLAQADRVIP
jgi:putative tryptophan/tyrosine transport system substrate-binding protein